MSSSKTFLQREISKLRQEKDDISVRIKSAQMNITESSKPLSSISNFESEMQFLQKSAEAQGLIALELRKKKLELEFQEISTANSVDVVELASLSSVPSRHSLELKLVFAAVIGMILSLILLFGIVEGDLVRGLVLAGNILFPFFLEENKIMKLKELEGLSLTPVAGLRKIPNKSSFSKFRSTIDTKTLSFEDNANAPLLNGFHYLADFVQRLQTEKREPNTTICVTSAGPQEGKSFLAYNLASCLASKKQPVLLIDFNLKAPLFRRTGAPFTGIKDKAPVALLGRSLFEHSSLPNFHVLMPNRLIQNATQLANGESLESLIDQLKLHYRFIIIDTGAATESADSLILSRMSDITLLIVTLRQTQRELLLEALERFKLIGQKQLFAVINQVTAEEEYQEVALRGGANLVCQNQDPTNEPLRKVSNGG
jgi:Mrp family chromosome partitioning ATPase